MLFTSRVNARVGAGLHGHHLLHEAGLTQLLGASTSQDLLDVSVDVSGPVGSTLREGQRGASQHPRCGRGGRE